MNNLSLDTSYFIALAARVLAPTLRAVENTPAYPLLHLRKLSNIMFLFTINYFKKSSTERYNNLTELTVIDNPSRVNRFDLLLLITSVEFNNRLALLLPLTQATITTTTSVYLNGSWSEREARDMFGIYFTNNHDLRRLLTDYGFEGFPLRKDFPLTGYLETRYDDSSQRVIYEPVELSQELRIFNVHSPWEKKNITQNEN